MNLVITVTRDGVDETWVASDSVTTCSGTGVSAVRAVIDWLQAVVDEDEALHRDRDRLGKVLGDEQVAIESILTEA